RGRIVAAAGHRPPARAAARVGALGGTRGELRTERTAPAAPVAAGNALLRRLESAGALPIEPKQAWTPVAQFAGRGLDAVNFGPGDPQLAHRRDERIRVDAMANSLSILRRFLCS